MWQMLHVRFFMVMGATGETYIEKESPDPWGNGNYGKLDDFTGNW